jgi:polysaccharide biosynthesis protein PslH
MSRSKLLFLCQNLPYPPHGGATIRSYNTLKLLSGDYDVTALCFDKASARENTVSRDEALRELGQFADVYAFDMPHDTAFLKKYRDHAHSVLAGRAYTRWLYESSEFESKLKEVVSRTDFDIVHMDSLDLAGYWPLLPNCPKAVVHHNVESQLLARRAAKERWATRTYMAHQASLLEREERTWAPLADVNIVVSSEDMDTLTSLAPGIECIVVPNGVDTMEFQPVPAEDREEVIFVGGYGWFPNRDGMSFFVKEVLPLIRKVLPSVPVTWVGRAPEAVREEMERVGVHMTGYVEDIRSHVPQARCYIVPLRVGGGTRLKILDAWALGKAVVSTSQGCEGLEIRPGENILVADEPKELARAVLEVLGDTSLSVRLEEGGRETAVRVYDWSVAGRPLLERYAELTLKFADRGEQVGSPDGRDSAREV